MFKRKYAIVAACAFALLLFGEAKAQGEKYNYSWVSTTEYRQGEVGAVPYHNGNKKYLISTSLMGIHKTNDGLALAELYWVDGPFAWVVISEYELNESASVNESTNDGSLGDLVGGTMGRGAAFLQLDATPHRMKAYTAYHALQVGLCILNVPIVKSFVMFALAMFIVIFIGNLIIDYLKRLQSGGISNAGHRALGDIQLPNGRWATHTEYADKIRAIQAGRNGEILHDNIIREVNGYASDARNDELQGQRRIWSLDDYVDDM